MLSYKEDIDGKKVKIGDLPCLAARSRFRSTKKYETRRKPFPPLGRGLCQHFAEPTHVVRRASEHQLNMPGVDVVAMNRVFAVYANSAMNMLGRKRHPVSGIGCEVLGDCDLFSRITTN